MYSSSITTYGGTRDAPDYVYYNASIVNNTTASTSNGVAFQDPQIRFNETRDTSIISDASQYYFSIIRFTMDGSNKDLPLFIPSIQEDTGQINPNLTAYSVAASFQLTVTTAVPSGTSPSYTTKNPPYYTITAVPTPRYIQFEPEVKNPILAPPPNKMNAPTFRGMYSATTQYQPDDIVAANAMDPVTLSYSPPYYQLLKTKTPWAGGSVLYVTSTIVLYNNVCYTCLNNIQSDTPPPQDPTNWVFGVVGVPPPTGVTASNTAWGPAPNELGIAQDLSTRYYWVNTFQHFVDLWNKTMFVFNADNQTDAPAATQQTITLSDGSTTTIYVADNSASLCAWQDTYNAFYASWLNSTVASSYTFPYATFASFCGYSSTAPAGLSGVLPPFLTFDTDTFKFVIQADSRGFGVRIPNFTPSVVVAPAGPIFGTIGTVSPPVCRLFFNENMYGILGNYASTYYNEPTLNAAQNLLRYGTFSQGVNTPFPVNGTATAQTIPIAVNAFPYTLPTNGPVLQNLSISNTTTTPIYVPDGYVYEVLFPNKNFSNTLNFNQSPYTPSPNAGVQPYTATYYGCIMWLAQQDFSSVDSLWSPIGSLVFTSTLLPIRPEATAAPVILGQGNLGVSSATVASAFQPIITDIAIDQSQIGGASLYRQFIYYAPQAEFRLSDFGNSKQEIRNIDIQVFWRNRLNNLLYPISMYNLSSVSIKVMLKHKNAPQILPTKGEHPSR